MGVGRVSVVIAALASSLSACGSGDTSGPAAGSFSAAPTVAGWPTTPTSILAGAAAPSTPLTAPSSPPDPVIPITTGLHEPTDACIGEPVVELVGRADRVTMDLVDYSEHNDDCGLNVDGEAMFDDSFRPATALHAPGGQLAIAADPAGEVSADVRPLRPGMRLAAISPSPDVLAVAANGTYPLQLPGTGCLVVTVSWRIYGRGGQFTGLAASQPDDCDDGSSASPAGRGPTTRWWRPSTCSAGPTSPS